jgi:hypothetical protein
MIVVEIVIELSIKHKLSRFARERALPGRSLGL